MSDLLQICCHAKIDFRWCAKNVYRRYSVFTNKTLEVDVHPLSLSAAYLKVDPGGGEEVGMHKMAAESVSGSVIVAGW